MSAVVVTGGHPFDADSFFAVFDAIDGLDWRAVAHPDAYAAIDPAALADGDVLVFYDMPGVEFTRADPPMRAVPPPRSVVEFFGAVTTRGVPMLFLHHAIASWPAWDGFASMLGGRFHYAPGRFGGRDWPSSGYRFDVTHEVASVDPAHPVCAGLDDPFTITDELYLFPVDEAAVTPLLRSRASFSEGEFFSADLAIRGQRDSAEGWHHPPGSDLVGWTRRVGASTVVYLQPGDGPGAHSNPSYRRLLANTIGWLSVW